MVGTFLITDRITFEPMLKSTGRVAMPTMAEAASCRLVSRDIRFDPSLVSLVTMWASRSAQPTHAEEGHHERKFQNGLATGGPKRCFGHGKLLSFFMAESTRRLTVPFG